VQVAVIIFALVLSILICVSVAWLVGRNLSIPGAKALFVAVVAEVWWLGMYLGELLSGTAALTIAFARLQWLGVVVIPVAWTVFVVEYTGRGAYLTGPRIAGLALIPGVAAVGSFVAFDGLIWRNISITEYNSVSMLAAEMAPINLIFSVFTWLVVTASAILLVEFVVDRGRLYTKRSLALIGAGTVPIVASIVDTFDLAGPDPFQLTPLTFALSSGLAAVAILEFDLFRSAPVPSHLAAETAVAAGDDPTFVLDAGGTVVDCNPAACALAGMERSELLGTPSDEVGPLADIGGTQTDPTVTVDKPGETRHYDVQRTAIDGDGEHLLGSVLTLRDVTDRRKRKQRLDALNDVLRATIQEEMTTVKRAVDDGPDDVANSEVLREHASVMLDVSDQAGELASMVEPEAESPADIVPIIHEEIDAAREWQPEVSFVLDATLDEWAHCSGLFEPVFRMSLRHAAKRSLGADGEPVVGISVTTGPEAVTVSVSDRGAQLSDHERAVLCEGTEPRPSDREDMSRWLINWGIEQAGGIVTVGTDGEHVSIELTFPRTEGGWDPEDR
jgi:PAS domain S-box-containing protein